MTKFLQRLRSKKRVSDEWLADQERREFGQGVDQSCIDWDAMKRMAYAQTYASVVYEPNKGEQKQA